MVKEVQITIGPEDVKKIGLQCTRCDTTVMIDLDQRRNFPDSCPVCMTDWRHGNAAERHRNFTELIRMLRDMEDSPMRIKMVVNDEDA